MTVCESNMWVLLLFLLISTARSMVPGYQCTDGTWIAREEVCDGAADCPDASDETKHVCVHSRCGDSMFRCRYGACVSNISKCNGVIDCADASDEAQCGHKEGSCNATEFHCDSGECVHQRQLCDGQTDCLDNSDEMVITCNDFPCPGYAFRCKSGACISRTNVCDGVNHCQDGSDELCKINTCTESQYMCGSGECISRRLLCDGQVHCDDTSDETIHECGQTMCPPHTFQCGYGACVAECTRCNGVPDCADFSDEVCDGQETTGQCRLPSPSPHARYIPVGCHGCQPGTPVNQSQELQYSCDRGHVLHGSPTVRCIDKEWTPHLPSCQPDGGASTCPAIASARLSVTCHVTSPGAEEMMEVPCDKPVPVGTTALYTCPPYYVMVNKHYKSNSSSTCKRDGTWSSEILQCQPECGQKGVEVTPLVVNGTEAAYGVLPWVASLFTLQSGNWTFWCGGSLVSEFAVVTAAHCVWKLAATNLRVGLGKFLRDYERTQEYTQMKEVTSIVNQPAYHDQGGNYGSDLAVLILATPAVLTSIVRPVCIDWDGARMQSDLANGSLGVVAGWGLNENETFSDTLRMTQLPVVASEDCVKAQHRDFKKYITYTSFCAGFANGTGVCNGDSGAGLVFPRHGTDDQWMLQGVVSVSPRRRGTSYCDTSYYTTFTKVGMYSKWLKSVLEPLEPSHNNTSDSTDTITEETLIRNL